MPDNKKIVDEDEIRASIIELQKDLLSALKHDTVELEKRLKALGDDVHPRYELLVDLVKLNAIVTTVLSGFVIKEVHEALTKEEINTDIHTMLRSMMPKQ